MASIPISMRPVAGAAFANDELFTPKEIAARWKMSVDVVRRIFRTEPGVMELSTVSKRLRRRAEIRIPRQVLERVERERTRA